MDYTIHKDGSFDIAGCCIQLLGCYPAIEGKSLHPIGVQTETDSILYHLVNGSIQLHFQLDECGRISLGCEVEGLPGIHDISPFANAQILNAERVFAQGFGMEGPSGDFSLQDNIPDSYGLTALHKGENTMLAYAEDHRLFGLHFSIADQQHFSACFNLEGTGGAFLTLPTLYFEESDGLCTGLHACAQHIAGTMHARHDKSPTFFWSSWYYAYETMDQQMLEETLQGLKASALPFQFVELDAGYTPSLGDWLVPNHRWPGGLQKAAKTILEAGFQPGIWVAPFIVGDRSVLYRDHPDWILHDRYGKPLIQLRSYTEPKIWGNPDCDYYVLDTSHPEALAYIAEVFRSLRSWGFSFFKTDFMLWNMHDSSTVQRFNPALTSVQILRNTLAAIREAIGEESYLLGCIAPFMPFIGYADGMRLAGDCGARWAEPYGPVNMLRELPCDNYFNHVFWQNDPDAMLLRDFATMLTPSEVRSLALFQALSGGIVSTSDPVHRLGSDRTELLNLVQPSGIHTPELPLFGSSHREFVITHSLPQGNLLFVMNPTDEELTVACRLQALFGENNWYQYRYCWEDAGVESVQENFFADTLAPHASALLFVTREPLQEKPANLWNW